MIGNPGRWFEIYVQDIGRAKKFYEAVFNCTLEKLSNPESMAEAEQLELWAFPMASDGFGAGGALVQMRGVTSGGNSTIIYFGCDDCALEASRVVAAGGKVEKEKFSIGQYGFIALAFDTEGNMFGMHSMQ